VRIGVALAFSFFCSLLGITSGGTGAPTARTETGVQPVAVSLDLAPTPKPTPGRVPEDGPEPFMDDLPADAVELAAVGDVNLGGRLLDTIAARGPDHLWTGVAPVLAAADIALVNLECTISERGAPEPKEFTFRGRPSSLGAMRRAGVDIASLGNNHAVDFGRDAFSDTLRHLRDNRIEAVGGGEDIESAWEPVYIERRGIRFGFVAATRVLPHNFAATDRLPGVASAYDEARLVASVREAERASDVTVVVVHWGTETHTAPNPVQVGLARTLVDAGADVIVGHHPHRLQPVVRMKGAVVAYSLGNFVFTSPSAAGRESMILRIGVMPDHSIVTARVPVRIGVDGRPDVADGSGRARA